MFVTFAFTLPAIAMPTRGWLKLSGYMLVVNAVFSVILGLYLWILTLRTKEALSPLWNAQQPRVQDLMQTTVRKYLLSIIFVVNTVQCTNFGYSSHAVDSSTAPRRPLLPTRRVRPRRPPP